MRYRWKIQQDFCTRLPWYTPKGPPKLLIGLANPLLRPLSKLGSRKERHDSLYRSSGLANIRFQGLLLLASGVEWCW